MPDITHVKLDYHLGIHYHLNFGWSKRLGISFGDSEVLFKDLEEKINIIFMIVVFNFGFN